MDAGDIEVIEVEVEEEEEERKRGSDAESERETGLEASPPPPPTATKEADTFLPMAAALCLSARTLHFFIFRFGWRDIDRISAL